MVSLYDFFSLKTGVYPVSNGFTGSGIVLLSVVCNANMIVTQLGQAAACQNKPLCV